MVKKLDSDVHTRIDTCKDNDLFLKIAHYWPNMMQSLIEIVSHLQRYLLDDICILCHGLTIHNFCIFSAPNIKKSVNAGNYLNCHIIDQWPQMSFKISLDHVWLCCLVIIQSSNTNQILSHCSKHNSFRSRHSNKHEKYTFKVFLVTILTTSITVSAEHSSRVMARYSVLI